MNIFKHFPTHHTSHPTSFLAVIEDIINALWQFAFQTDLITTTTTTIATTTAAIATTPGTTLSTTTSTSTTEQTTQAATTTSTTTSTPTSTVPTTTTTTPSTTTTPLPRLFNTSGNYNKKYSEISIAIYQNIYFQIAACGEVIRSSAGRRRRRTSIRGSAPSSTRTTRSGHGSSRHIHRVALLLSIILQFFGCGAILLSCEPMIILSAAHCFFGSVDIFVDVV